MDKRIYSFLAMAYGIAWAIAGVGIALGVRATSGVSYMVVGGLCMLAPAIAAIIQQRLIDREPWAGLGVQLKGTRWGILALTVLIGISIVPLYFAVVHVLGGQLGVEAFGQVSITSERLVANMEELREKLGSDVITSAQLAKFGKVPAVLILLAALGGSVFAAFTVNLPFMLGEELGWRGYLWQRSAHWSALRRVLFTGVVWGLWHAPLIAVGHNYPGYPVKGILLMTLFCVVLSFLFDWTRKRSKSIWSSGVLHGIINGSAGVTVLFVWDGHTLIGSVAGIAGIVGIAVLVVVVLLFDTQYRAQLLQPAPMTVPEQV